jgi:hypothetical protein
MQAHALAALQRLYADADAVTPADGARLLDLRTRLERLTFSTSVEQLQTPNGVMPVEDPWTRRARELSGS